MLVTLREVLADARVHQYAVPAFDCTEDIMARTILETAEANRSPLILMALEGDLDSGGGRGWKYIAGVVRAVASDYRIPVVLHLDHASSLDVVQRGLDHGFTSVMIDGSALPFAENVKLTKAAVDMAAPLGVSVEAELGLVGGMDLAESSSTENVLTEPGEVSRFVELTGVDALAVSIGTSHGVYRSLPVLNIDRLKQLNEASRVPLVLHGGSGTPQDQLQAAIRNGISKINMYADLRVAMYRGLQASATAHTRIDPLPCEMFRPIRDELAAAVAEKIDMVYAKNRV
jgi:fructose-bisphosphate aldolase class II